MATQADLQMTWLRLRSGSVLHACVSEDIKRHFERTVFKRSMGGDNHTGYSLCGRSGLPNMEPFFHPTSYGAYERTDPHRYPRCKSCTRVLLAALCLTPMPRSDHQIQRAEDHTGRFVYLAHPYVKPKERT